MGAIVGEEELPLDTQLGGANILAKLAFTHFFAQIAQLAGKIEIRRQRESAIDHSPKDEEAASCRGNAGKGGVALAEVSVVVFFVGNPRNRISADDKDCAGHEGRFLRALDRRCRSLGLPIEATVAADGGNISRQILLTLEKRVCHYVLRLPRKHVELPSTVKSTDLPQLGGSLKGKVRARRLTCLVYGVERGVVDQYSARMHRRQRP